MFGRATIRLGIGPHSSLFICLSVCLSVNNFAEKLPNEFASDFQGRLAMGQ